MPAQIAIIAALPREVATLVRGTAADAALVKRGVWLYRMEGAVVVAAGMGAERAAVAVEAAGEAEMLISTGLAGGCAPGVVAGSVMEAGVVVDARTGERFVAEAETGVTLATASSIASVSEKARLAESYGAALVDMEAATVARLAEARGLKFRAVKAISDEFDFEMKELAKFGTPDGQFREAAFGLHVALRPWMWGSVMTMAGNSKRSAEALCAALRVEL